MRHLQTVGHAGPDGQWIDDGPVDAAVPVMADYVEDAGHRWPAGGTTRYDRVTETVVRDGPQQTGDEPCTHCGMTYRQFSQGLQGGILRPCSTRSGDEVLVIGPPS